MGRKSDPHNIRARIQCPCPLGWNSLHPTKEQVAIKAFLLR